MQQQQTVQVRATACLMAFTTDECTYSEDVAVNRRASTTYGDLVQGAPILMIPLCSNLTQTFSSFQWTYVNISDGFKPSARRNAMGGIAPESHLMIVSCGWNKGYLSDTFMLDLEYNRWIEREIFFFISRSKWHDIMI